MRPTSTKVPNAVTRQRLLEAAGEIFAERGFRNATVREICQRAQANIAAVNYHFGDKARLYAAILQYAFACALEKYPATLGLSHGAPATQRLRAFIRSFLLRILDEGQPSWHGRLVAREMAEPTSALDDLVKEAIRPNYTLLISIVRDLLGPDTPEDRVRWCAGSILGQCLFYHHARPVLDRLHPGERYGPEEIERLADHITQFSLAGIGHG